MEAARRTPHPNVLLGLVTTLVFTTRGSLSTAFDAYVLLLPDGTNLRVGILGLVDIDRLVFLADVHRREQPGADVQRLHVSNRLEVRQTGVVIMLACALT